MVRSKLWVLMALCLFSAAAHAQTEQETLTFLFDNSIVSGSPDNHTPQLPVWPEFVRNRMIDDKNCIVTYAGTYYTTIEGERKFNGKSVGWRVDFNTLIMSAAIIKNFRNDVGRIDIAGETGSGSVITNGWTFDVPGESNVRRLTETFDDLVIAFRTDQDTMKLRLINAFKYFKDKFCGGSKRPF